VWFGYVHTIKLKGLFGLQNRAQEGIVILMFDMGLFLGIPILIGIPIPLRRGISIRLKNERNIYSNGNRLNFSKKHNYFLFSFSFFFFKKKKKKGEKSKPHPPLTAMGGWPATNGSGGGATTPGAIWGWHRPPPILIGDFDCIPINVY